MKRPEVTVILAGGEGRRMGGGKPLRTFEGLPLIDHAIGIAQRQSGLIAVAVRAPEQVAGRSDVTLLHDDPAVEGPLAGLASALAFARRCGAGEVLTIPCDAPRLPADLGWRLRDGLTGSHRVAMASSHGRLHPTCALWRVSVLPNLADYRASGRGSLMGLAEVAGMATVDWGEAHPDPFVNLNTLQDLERETRSRTRRLATVD